MNTERSQATMFYPIVYPERRMVTREQLTLWASDAVANGDTSIEATNEEIEASFALVRQVLDDSGYATIVGATP